MVEATPAPDKKSRQTRFRIIFTVSVTITLACVLGYFTYAAQGVNQMEQRIVAGDFVNVRLEASAIDVAADGKVLGVGVPDNRYVASLKLVPPGKYRAMLVANDGNPAHIAKSEMVIAAQDAAGKWHPESAPHLLDRLRSPHPGQMK